jgi:hypothetical protein
MQRLDNRLQGVECVIVSGPMACGKTRNAEALRTGLNCAAVYEYEEKYPLPEGRPVLVLTNKPLEHFTHLSGAILISFDRAMQATP